jgi:hypothetical protein
VAPVRVETVGLAPATAPAVAADRAGATRHKSITEDTEGPGVRVRAFVRRALPRRSAGGKDLVGTRSYHPRAWLAMVGRSTSSLPCNTIVCTIKHTIGVIACDS